MWGESIPIGVIFRNRRPTYEERNPVISQAPLVEQAFDRSKLAAISREFTEAGTRGGWRILRRESEVLRRKRFEWRHQRWRVTKMSMKSYIIKEGTLRIHGGAANNPSKTLLTLYQRKGLDIARAGSPSPLAGVSGRPAGS